MPLPKLSLQVFEAFEHVARSGSVRRAAREMGVSISSVSHHVSRLEAELGATLFDRSSRPFVLTREGREALHHLSLGLQHLRRATSETAVGGLLGARALRIGIVEDFESNVAPDLAVTLAARMPRATLTLSHILSHQAPDLLRTGALDVAIAAEATEPPRDLIVEPLARDPFLLVKPRVSDVEPQAFVAGTSRLPFLRFNPGHLIGKQIDAHLRRNRVSLPERFIFDSVQSIMAVIASGGGWSLVTPLGCVRAQRYAGQVDLQPLPLAPFARRISLMARQEFDARMARAIAALVRQSITRLAIEPLCRTHPWLQEGFVARGAEG